MEPEEARHAIVARVDEIASEFGLSLSNSDEYDCVAVLAEIMRARAIVRRIAQDVQMLSPGGREFIVPAGSDNRNNAWHVKCEMRGRTSGPLMGKRVVLDDSIAVAGLPMRVGADIFRGHYPSFDAEIVTRILDAGAVIAGKANCEYLRLGYGSHTSDCGPIHNPRSSKHTAGGPASGAAAIVAAGEAAMAIGAGTFLIPAALCGLVGVKPTNGLVSLDGIFSLGPAWDHVGPITNNVADATRLLSVLTGASESNVELEFKGRLPTNDVSGARVGLLQESIDSLVDGRVTHVTRMAVSALRQAGCDVSEVSLPLHKSALAIRRAAGWSRLGDHLSFARASLGALCGIEPHASAFGAALDVEVAPGAVKLATTIDAFVRSALANHHATVNLAASRLRNGYDDLLRRSDVLMLPTVPSTAPRQMMTGAEATGCDDSFDYLGRNCVPFDVTGHPAITVPWAEIDGLPVGVMFVGRHYDEVTIMRIAMVLEQLVTRAPLCNLS